ncbi:hypothetical protein IH785_17900 [candidate division KSB1 bacterium]|nr:hypothetical protein [candidate division KSB1 bacterium]
MNLEILQNNFSVNRLFIIDGSFKTLLDTKVDAPIGISPPHLKINLREVNAALSGKAVYSTLYEVMMKTSINLRMRLCLTSGTGSPLLCVWMQAPVSCR